MRGFTKFFVSLSGASAVIMGAVAAHALKNKLSAESLALIDKAVLYQMFHTLAILAIVASTKSFGRFAVPLFSAGIIFFSGSLYIYALTSFHPMVYLTPIGGFCFIFGWLGLLFKSKA